MLEKRSHNLRWRWVNLFAREPRRIHLTGTALILLGAFGLLLVLLFARVGSEEEHWLRFAFLAAVATGSCFVLWANTIASPPFVLTGSPMLVIGLVLATITAGIAPRGGVFLRIDDAVTGGVGAAAYSMIVIACILFLVQAGQDLRKPAFGPQNFFFFGALMFGLGALIFLMLIMTYFPGLSVPYSVVLGPLAVFASTTFFTGALFLFLSSSLTFTNLENMILHRYPSTAVLQNFPRAAKLYRIAVSVGLLGAHVAAPALVFISLDTLQHLWPVFVGCILVAAARLAFALAFVAPRDWLSVVSSLILSVAWILMAIFAGLPNTQPNVTHALEGSIATAAGALGLIGAALAALRAARLAFRGPGSVTHKLLATGTYPFWGEMLQATAFLLLLIYGSMRASNVFISVRVLTLWAILSQTCHFLLMLHGSNVFEVATSLNFQDDEWRSDQSMPPELLAAAPPVEGDWAGAEAVRGDAPYDVIIVGGGPAGLTAANECGQRNVRTLVLDKKTSVVADSRFFVVNSATCEGLARVGVLERILERGQATHFGWGASLSSGMSHPDMRVFCQQEADSRDVATAYGSNGSALSASRSATSVHAAQHGQRVMQSVQEASLLEAALERPSVTVRFDFSVLDFRVSTAGDGVWVLAERQSDQRRFVYHCRYLIGCDGPASVVARRLQTRFDGFTQLHSSRSVFFRAPGLLAAVEGKLSEGHQYHICRPGFGIGYFAGRDCARGLWTFHLHGMYDGRNPGTMTPEEMPDVLREFIGLGVEFEIISDGRWRWNFAVARTFSKGPVFLCGDSAHQWPPFAAMGGNTAYQDVVNLGWKLAAVIQGWAPASLLDSYQWERRSQCLRVAMLVATMTPDPNRLKMLGRIIWMPLLRWLGQARWYYGNSGVHSGNHYSSSGMTMGQRYDFSPIVVGASDASAPPEDPLVEYVPKVVPGGRVLHVAMQGRASLQDLVNVNGYTLIVSSADARVAVAPIEAAFQQINVPLHVVDAVEALQTALAGARNAHSVQLWRDAGAALCRPDLYVAWTLEVALRRGPFAATEAAQLAAAACGLVGRDNELARQAECNTHWLTWRFVQQLLPMRFLFSKGVFVKNTIREVTEVTKMTVRQSDPHAQLYADLAERAQGDGDHDDDGDGGDVLLEPLPQTFFYGGDKSGDDSFEEFARSKK